MIPVRTVHHANALFWLRENPKLEGCSFVTSMPDISEFPTFDLSSWKSWFVEAGKLVLNSCADDGVVIFYQTDIKRDGVWVDKGFLCQKAAEQTGHEFIAHKVICRAPPAQPTFGRPGYSHMLCFSKTIRPEIKKATADVLPLAGATTWTRGMGLEACKLACKFIRAHTKSHTIVDPFCGHGSLLAVANDFGFNAIGIELSLKRAKKARELRTVELEK